jgi:glc operon protein GlcG
MKLTLSLLLLALSALRTALGADLVSQSVLTLEGAKHIAAAAVGYAHAHGAPGASIAIVDVGGHTLYLERLDGTFGASSDVSIGKARTAANFMRTTRAMEDSINNGRPALAAVIASTPFTPLRGGVPIIVKGQIVGAIGVSGAASAEQDEQIAIAGAQALESPHAP